MMNPSDDTKIEVLAAHYENTYQEIAKVLARRDRSFLMLVFVLIYFWLRLAVPGELESATVDLATNRLGMQYVPNIQLIDSVFWCLLLGICIRYFQCTVEVNRLYNYMHSVEVELKSVYGGTPFTREGEFYNSNYHLFKWWAGLIYTIFFPLLLCVTIVTKIAGELCSRESVMNTAFDAIVGGFALVSVLLFVWPGFRNHFEGRSGLGEENGEVDV